MKSVLFTFDYELFLGNRSGNVKECLLDPTSRLLELFQHYGFKAVFFVDTVYLMRLQDIAATYAEAARDLADIQVQMAAIVEQGHTVFPHIHAHWLDAVYMPSKNEWSLENTRYYQFSSVPTEVQELLFEKSMQIIRSLAGSVEQNYKVDAYRAGGWSIQPFSHFKPHFLKYGIMHEFSVIPGKYHFSDAHVFDFRTASRNSSIYQFSDDPCVEDKAGPFTEWTISTLTMTRFEKWINFKVGGLIQRFGKIEKRKGTTVSSVIKEEGDSYGTKDKIRTTASFEGLNPFIFRKYISAIRKSCYFQFISHPKLITNRDFYLIEKLFSSLKNKYQIETDFRKIIS